MIIDYDWHVGRYTFFLPEFEEEESKSKPRCSKGFDRYESKELLKDLLKNIDIVKEISEAIKEKGFYESNNPKVARLLEDETQRSVLMWFVTEHTEYFLACTNGNISFIYNADYELVKKFANENDIKYTLVRPDYMANVADWNPEDNDYEVKLDGFTEYTLFPY